MAASKGYGCFACVCGFFLVILGFGLGFIIGYFVLKQPIYLTPLDDGEGSPVYEDFEFLVDAVNDTEYTSLIEEFDHFLQDKQNEKNVSHFIHQKFKDFGLDHIELQHRKFLITPPDGDYLNKLKITDNLGRIFFQTNFAGVKQPYSGVHSPLSKIYEETVFVNHADSSDFRLLQQNKVGLENKIFIARCGSIHLDNMIQNSQSNGARGLLYYIDPKNPPIYEHMCRSTSNIFLLKETDPEKALISRSIRIPVQQISYEDVENLFRIDSKGISNRKLIHKWNYPISAQINATVCQKCKADLEIRSSPQEHEMFNVVGKIHGQLEPDRYIIIGSHRNYIKNIYELDTGTKTLLQLVGTFQTLKKQGWHPKRTLIFASFSARNYGNLGAIKWLDENFEDISKNAVVYINVGSQKSIDYQIESSSEATTALFSAAHRAKKIIGSFLEKTDDFANRSAILSGYSDTTPFAYSAGIPAIDFTFGDLCDENFKLDTNKTIMGTCAQIALSLILEFSDATLTPLNLKYLVAQLSNSFENLFSFDSEYKNELHKYGINLGELRNSIKDFEDKVRMFYESDIEKRSLLRRVVNDITTKVLRTFIAKQDIVKPLFRNPMFLPTSSNLLKVSAFQGIINYLELVENDPATSNVDTLKNHFQDIVERLHAASKILQDVLSM